MKKILLLFSLSLCVFSLTACFKSKPKEETLVESYDEENALEQPTEDPISALQSQIEALQATNKEIIEKLDNLTKLVEKGNSTKAKTTSKSSSSTNKTKAEADTILTHDEIFNVLDGYDGFIISDFGVYPSIYTGKFIKEIEKWDGTDWIIGENIKYQNKGETNLNKKVYLTLMAETQKDEEELDNLDWSEAKAYPGDLFESTTIDKVIDKLGEFKKIEFYDMTRGKIEDGKYFTLDYEANAEDFQNDKTEKLFTKGDFEIESVYNIDGQFGYVVGLVRSVE